MIPTTRRSFIACAVNIFPKNNIFFVDRCDRGIMRAQLIMESRQEQLMNVSSRSGRNSKTEVMRQRVEIESLLQVFLNLSALNEKDPLLDAVLDAMCSCTGVDFGILFLYENGKLIPLRARGCPLIDLQENLNPALGIDKWFLEKCEQEGKREPRIRPVAWRTPHPACDGSAMVVPLPYKDKVYGYCYLANSGSPTILTPDRSASFHRSHLKRPLRIKTLFLQHQKKKKPVWTQNSMPPARCRMLFYR